jgi:TolB-like protein
VHYLLEGSLQADGDRVRITVQLINAASGNHASIVIRCHPGNRPLTIAR